MFIFTVIFLIILISPQVSWALLGQEENDVEYARLKLWSQGAFDVDSEDNVLGPISYVRHETLVHRITPHCDMNGYCKIRGGSQDGSLPVDYGEHIALKIKELGARFGPEFIEAIERNKVEHAKDCERSCEIYYCADPSKPLVPLDSLLGETTIKSYSMGPVPPEDFAESFG